MLNHHTLDKLRSLRLTGMADALDHQHKHAQADELGFDERLGMLVDQEILHRENRRLERLLKEARLRVNACLEDVDYRHPRGLKRAEIAQLAGCEWIQRQHNLCLTGPTGSGKTWLACAIGTQACRQGLSVRYFRLPRLLEALRVARGDGSYPRVMTQLARTQLLVIDDWAIAPLTATQRGDLMEVIEERHGNQSTLIASQLPIEHWHDYIGEATLADAILDRLLHNARRIVLSGESMRKAS